MPDDPREPSPSAQRLFAMYVQATKEMDAQGLVPRFQWIVVPRTPEIYNGVRLLTGGVRRNAVLHHRKQDHQEHRAGWKYSIGPNSDPDLRVTMAGLITRVEKQPSWRLSPVIVVETCPEELFDSNVGKTPWPILKRANKIAKRQHGFTIF